MKPLDYMSSSLAPWLGRHRSMLAASRARRVKAKPQPGPRLKIERDLEYARAGGQALTLDLYRPDPSSTPTPRRGVDPWRRTAAFTEQGAHAGGRARDAGICRREHRLPQRRRTRRSRRRWPMRRPPCAGCAPTRRASTSTRRRSACLAMTRAARLPRSSARPAMSRRSRATAATAASPAACRRSSTLAGPVDRARRVNPLAHVTKDDAPTLILHGTADTVVPTLESQALVSALKVAGVERHAGAADWRPHDLGALLSPLAMQQVTGFFDQQLRGAPPRGGHFELSVDAADRIRRPGGASTSAARSTRPTRRRCAGQAPIASYRIYLPPDYETSGTRRYPVIYFMHGSLVDSKRPIVAGYVARVDAAIRSGVMPPTIVVMPQGLNQNRWMDSRDGTKPMESVIMKNLIPHIDATYRTIATREGRAIEGHSMGGFGALHNGFNNPDLFIAVTGNAPGGATLEMGEGTTPAPDASTRSRSSTAATATTSSRWRRRRSRRRTPRSCGSSRFGSSAARRMGSVPGREVRARRADEVRHRA